ncbi:MAG: galactokinase family protein [Verrucomicrobiota bacterium]|nr:galactokinase family protein [Verrucomicrobiota bacterium]
MPSPVAGAKPVREWLSLLDDPRSPLHFRFREIYGAAERVAEPARICRRAVESFAKSFGADANVLLVRSTGRINLLGTHIDHCGGSVNPIAIKELFWVAEPREDDRVLTRNVESREFPDEEFAIGACLLARSPRDWDAWCHDEFEKRKDDPRVTWSNYARAATLYLQHLHRGPDGAFAPRLRGMNAMVCGSIPRAAGLSTSSSLVVAAVEACARINGLRVGDRELVDWCGRAEWYVGTRGGAGDHAAIKFGQPGAVVHMTGFPLTVKSVPFPAGYRVALANSLVEASKRTNARDVFNNRVASCVFGLLLARKNFPLYTEKLRHLRDINPTTLGVDEVEIYRVILSLPEQVTRRQILELLPESADEARHVFRSHAEPPDGYRIRQVCLYGVAECIRSDMAVALLERNDVRGFGELIAISHDGDRVTRLVGGRRAPTDNRYPDARLAGLIADLRSGDPARVARAQLWRQPGGYDVSVPEVDELVDLSLSAPGVAGAERVGAGLGGSIVALVEEERAGDLIERLAERYYRPRGLPVCAEIVAPVGGAGVIDV